jgi:hypothetical protein
MLTAFQLNVDQLRNNSNCDLDAQGATPLLDLIKVQKTLSHENHVLTPQEVNYWEQRAFESAPFFALGGAIKNHWYRLGQSVSETILSGYSFLSNKIKKLTRNIDADYSKVTAAIEANDQDTLAELAQDDELSPYIAEQTARYRQIHAELELQYTYLEKNIDLGLQQARKNKKPLMILAGEDHESVHSALIESLLAKIALKKLNLNSIHTEPFFLDSYPTWLDGGLPIRTVELFSQRFNIPKIPIDYAICGADKYWRSFGVSKPKECDSSNKRWHDLDPISDMGITIRNEDMVMRIEPALGDKLVIVGGAHLYGMLKETNITHTHFVLPIFLGDLGKNDFHYAHKSKNRFSKEVAFLGSDEVLRAQVPSVQYDPFAYNFMRSLTPQLILKKADETHNSVIKKRLKPRG